MEVKATHKDCLRFYWFRDPFKEPTDDNLVEYRFERVPFGLKSAPFLLAGVIKLHLESVGTPLALEMLKNCYVDNVLLTADTVSEALAKYREAKEIFAQIGMPLREFASNSAEFNTAVDPADRADLTKLKELGIRWDILSDYWDIPLMPKQAVPPTNLVGGQTCLAASPATQGAPTNLVGPHETGPATQQKRKGRKKADDGRLSKRNMLRLIARIFDPQGLAQAATLLAKLAVQEAWKAEKDWDDEITGELADLWNEAIKDFGTTTIRVPRRVAKGKIKAVEIHVFTDGSSYAYGFTAYLRIINADGTYSTNLVYSRARVKPIKDAEKFTIPRMELLGVLLGTRIAQYLHKELPVPVSATYLWSDSTIVLHQIANDEAIKEVWTENRLKEIRLLRDSCNIQFRYVPTAENPADIISRGIPAAELQKCEMWWFGAPFLARDSSRWPEQPTTIRTRPSPSDKPLELFGSTAFTTLFLALPSRQRPKQWIRQRSQRKKPNPLDAITEPLPPTSATFSAVATMVNATNLVAKPPKLPSEPILPRETEEKFDRWPRLVRIQYNVVRFAAACLRQLRHKLVLRQKKRRYAPALGFDLGQCVTTLGRQPTLRDLHLVTMIILRKTQLRHPPSAHDRRNMGIFESHGLLYVKGRLGNMKLRPTALTPLYLPREARDTELIILEYHRINGHAGVATTLANLRMRYWFTKGRTTIQKALRKHCFACRRESMHPFAVPPWPQLPTSRVTNARPFFFTGLDFFGPLYLRAPNGSGSYYTAKYYVCIFHFSTDAFLHAFKRFGFRREFPRRILSDNGLSFITAREVINRISGRSSHAHKQPVKRTLPVRKAVSARLAARRMPALTAAPAATRLQRRAPTNLVGPSAVQPLPQLTRDEDKLVDFCQRHNIEWQTITELSPWRGGVYERLIGLIKHCLRRSIGNTKPTVVEFLSLLLCAEHTVNCRPLSYVADSDTDFLLIRPLDFLIPMLDQEAHQYPLDPATDDSTPDDPDFIGPGENKLHAKIMKDLTKGRRLADSFWQTFRDGVLLDLRSRGIDRKRRQFGEETIQPGDLVLVSETDVPRSEWRLALVLELLPHSDGLVRSARIRYASTKRETNRALEHLYPIGKIPRDSTALSTVSRLGLCFTILLSDISTTTLPDSMSNTTNTPSPDQSSPATPISAAIFDSTGGFALLDVTPPSPIAPTDQEVAAPTNLVGQPPTVSAVPDDSAPTNLVGQEIPAPQVATAADPIGLPTTSAPRPPLFDPVELAFSHARQIGVACEEQMRIQDIMTGKLRRCLELDAQGLPSSRAYADLERQMNRRLGSPMWTPGAPKADPLRDQSTQTDEAAPPQEQHTQTDAEMKVTTTTSSSVQCSLLEDAFKVNATFWSKVTVSGMRTQDTNPFVAATPPDAAADAATPPADAANATTIPVSRSAPLPILQDPMISARAAAEARRAEATSNGLAATNLVAPVPAVQAGLAATNLVAPVPAPRAPRDQIPFNPRGLLRARPINTTWPDFPSIEVIERRTRQFFAHYTVASGQRPPVLEPIDASTLYTRPAETAQKLSFGFRRNGLCPMPSAWDPADICYGDGEQDCFHRTIRRLRLIQATRWLSGKWKRDATLVRDLQALLDRYIPSFGHMILLIFVVARFNKNTNVRAVVTFLTRMLDSLDFEEDIPVLFARAQPDLIVQGTREPWPTDADLKTAAKHWLCYCQRAYREIFDRLSGPAIWTPEWMLHEDLPSEARRAFDQMSTNAG
ncbi:CBN-SRU-33 protein, partial [Aphelenchoides avenae]